MGRHALRLRVTAAAPAGLAILSLAISTAYPGSAGAGSTLSMQITYLATAQ